MEAGSSSLTSELFGLKESNPSSSEIFGSIFSRESPKVLVRESLNTELSTKRQDSATKAWKTENPDEISKKNESEYQNTPSRDSYVYHEQRVQPCHLSSSIYYGGQDIYSHPLNNQSSVLNSVNDGEDDSGSASRGNWWQGSLYY